MLSAERVSMNNIEGMEWLQRRIMRLLLTHDRGLFRQQFRLFFVESTLPQIPLLQQYDRYIRLLMLSDELLDDIMPRIRRQLSLQTDSARLIEEAPTRGDIDWPRTFERNLREQPGALPMCFDTRLRQRSTVTPENLLTTAILATFRRELQYVLHDDLGDEQLSGQERSVLISADERAERELAAPYARALLEQIPQTPVEMERLVEQVAQRLRPGGNPYRDLVGWWQRFNDLRIGHAEGERRLAVASQREDEKVDAWLYELWIALEFVHLLAEQQAVSAGEADIQTDLLQFLFTWKGRRFHFSYNRQHGESGGEHALWQHGPASRPDYSIEREQLLKVEYDGVVTWREAPFVMDAKYYLAGSDPTRTHGPIKKLLGDMTLLDAAQGALFFPRLPEPPDGTHITRTLMRRPHRHSGGRNLDLHIQLYHLAPDMPVPQLQERLRAILDAADTALQERTLACCGFWLDPDNSNASGTAVPANTIVCPKPHIGPNVFDLVNAETDCLKNPRLCHVIGQSIIRPEVTRVTSRQGLQDKSQRLRQHNDEHLSEAERQGDEERAEQLRTQILNGVGKAAEQYVAFRGDTIALQVIEKTFNSWYFKGCWESGSRALAEATRNMLMSGEYIWNEYEKIELKDWAAPAIQYCRALEYECRRRLYAQQPQSFRLPKAGWTLGVLKRLSYCTEAPTGDDARNWRTLRAILQQADCPVQEFETMLLVPLVKQRIVDLRNSLAHGEPIAKATAETLRTVILGESSQVGLLSWLATHLDPKG